MTREASAKLGPFIAGMGVLVTLTAYWLGSAHAGASAAVGAGFAIANFYVWRWLVGRIVDQRMSSKPALSLLLVVKAAVGLGAPGVLLLGGVVAPIPFVVGFGSLVGGLIFGSAMLIATGGALEGEA